MIILSVDYGDMRTGVAVCDKMGILASPVGVVKGDYAPKVAEEIKKIASDKKAELIVVGLPKNLDGSEGDRAEKCRSFGELLENVTGIKTVMFDERLTTVSAHRALSAVDVRGQKRKDVVDAVSAVMILEDYLRSN